MSECSCMQARFKFGAYKKLSPRFWNKNRYDYFNPIYSQVITIHGDNLKEIEEKKQQIIDELKIKYSEPKYSVEAWSYNA